MINLNIQKNLSGANGEMFLDVNLSIQSGSFVALSGDSGGGKTTLLRILSGLEKAKGNIEVDGEIWQNEKIFLPPQKRKIGFVFQDYALFPNMNVEENLLFVKNDKKLCDYLLDMVNLTELKKRNVCTLSGGQQQRVSLCRALMNRPKLLLLDEPLSALNPEMRNKLQDEILSLHKEFNTTTILVSHDPSEIYKLASRVLKVSYGKIIHDASPKEVLLYTKGTQKFSFSGEILDICKVDVIFIATISIGQQLVEVVISSKEAKDLKIGQRVTISTKAFSPNISYEGKTHEN